MKIVDVCAFYAPRGGGVRTYVDRKLLAAQSHGHEVVVVAPGEATGEERRGPGARIRWLRSPSFPLDTRYRFFADRGALHAVLTEERPDVVEVSSPWRSASMVADWRGDALRTMIAHADPLSAYAYRWFGGIADRVRIDRGFAWYWRHLRRLNDRMDMIVSPSESLSKRLRAGGLTKVVTNPMGVEADVFSPARRDPALRRALLAQCGLGEDATLLLGVGRHAPEKRWEMVARAATIAGLSAPVALAIVGDGHARKRIVRATGDNPHIRLLAPVNDRVALARLLASADALIHGCEAETFSFVAAEAVASGLPVIAPDEGGAGDHARASHGFCYAPADAEQAAAAILACRDRGHRAKHVGPNRTMDMHFAELWAHYTARVGTAGHGRMAA